MKKIKQKNNLIIKFSEIYNKYQVITPTKTVLEEFNTLEQAIDFAKRTKDFIEKKEEK